MLSTCGSEALAFNIPTGPAYPRQLYPCSRNSPLIISEISYHPPAPYTNDLEYVELYNTEPVAFDLSGYRIDGDIQFTFPVNTSLPARSYLIVAANPSSIGTNYGITNVLGPFTNRLNNAGGTLQLRNARGSILLEVVFKDNDPWPTVADGAGHSLVLGRPDYGEADPRAWQASAAIYGNPGGPDVLLGLPQQSVVINEVLSHTDLPQLDFVELFNYSSNAVDLSGCWITDGGVTNEYRIPNGTTIPPYGFVAFDENSLRFRLNAAGERVWLLNSNRSVVLDAVKFGATANGVSLGRFPDGQGPLRTLSGVSFGATNHPPSIPAVVINEIMYHPISENDDDEYIELFNRSPGAVDLSHWRFTEGIDFVFTPGTSIPASGYLVVARNRTNLMARYPYLNANPQRVVGNYSGKLDNGGETLTLSRPDDLAFPDKEFITVNAVRHGDGLDWGRWADGDGSSLELTDAHSDNTLAMNWAGSDETAKAPWTNIEFTGVVADTQVSPVTRLYVWLLDQGEALLDNVEVRIGGGGNLVQNSGFDTDASGWAKWGNHTPSFWQSSNGYSGAGCYHLRAQAAGFMMADKLIGTLSGSIVNGNSVTIRAKVRWLAGSPQIVIPLKGTGLEAAGRMSIPANLGTPGQPNSRLAPGGNAGPAMTGLQHAPILPAAGQSVTITCSAHDPDGVTSVRLFWRLDSTSPGVFDSVTMLDDGTGGDMHPRDGVYSGVIPGQAAGSLVEFYVEAADGTRTNTLPIPDPYYSMRGLVRFGEVLQSSAFGSYQIWMRANDVAAWDAEPPSNVSNQPWPMTFVWHGMRAFYCGGIHFSGSAFTRASFSNPVTGNNNASYVFKLRDVERFLGNRTFKMDSMQQDRSTYQRSKLSMVMGNRIGTPVLYARYIHLYMNGAQRGTVFTDAQTPNTGWIGTHFPDEPDGYLHEIQKPTEYNDSIAAEGSARFGPFTYVRKPDGYYRKNTYRVVWDRKAHGPRDDDFSELFRLYDAMNATVNDAQVASFESTMDIPEFVLPLVMRHLSTDQDGMGYNDVSNGLIYKPLDGKWKFIPWDFDTGWGVSRAYTDQFPPTSNMNSQDSKLYSFWQRPAVQRAYWRSVVLAVDWLATNGVVHLNNWNAVLSAPSNSIAVANFSTLLTFVNNRVGFLRTAIINANLSPVFAITNNVGANFSTTNYLLTLGGTAPVAVDQLRVNGSTKRVAPRWLNNQTWQFQLGLQPGANVISLTGHDVNGNQIASTSITVTYTGAAVSPIGDVVINELMVAPLMPRSEFIELYNRSPTQAYDLGGLRLKGLDHVIRHGTIIQPNGFIVIAQNEAVWTSVYGTTNIAKLAGDYTGRLDNKGETITLLMTDGVTVVDQVTYGGASPWASAGWDGTGFSFQLIDPSKDNNQVWNWAAAPPTPGTTNAVAGIFPPLAQMFISEVQPNNANTIQDNTGQYAPWVELLNPGGTVTLTNFFLTDNYAVPTKWAFPSGVTLTYGQRLLIWCDGRPAESSPPANLHTSFGLSSTGGVVGLVQISGTTTALVSHVSYHAIAADQSYGRYPNTPDGYLLVFNTPTPRAANGAVFAGSLKINEWMASNTKTIADPADGHFDDWVELHNSGVISLDLTGYTLTDSFANPNKWTFPAGSTIPAHGFLLVWADEDGVQPGLHASFKLAASGEEIALFTPGGQLVDHVVFGPQTADISEGHYPDGTAPRYFMPTPSPLAANVIPAPLILGLAPVISNSLVFSFGSLMARQYQVEHKPDLSASSTWLPLGGIRVGTGGSLFVTNTIIGSSQRFYRVVLLP